MTKRDKDVEGDSGQVVADLREARGVLKAVKEEAVRERLELLLARAELGVNDLCQRLAESTDPDHPAAASSEDFAAVLEAIKAKWPDGERLTLISDLGTSGRYTSAQVRTLLETFGFDENKVEAAVRLYPHVTDPEHFFQALEAIDSSFKRDEARARLNLK